MVDGLPMFPETDSEVNRRGDTIGNQWTMREEQSNTSSTSNEETPAERSTEGPSKQPEQPPINIQVSRMGERPQLPARNIAPFDGTNISEFLDEYDSVMDYYDVHGYYRITTLLTYCNHKQREVIRPSKAYTDAKKNQDWESLREALVVRYRQTDSARFEVIPEQFIKWLSECQSTSQYDIQGYLDDYEVKSSRCIAAKTIESRLRGYYLVKGLSLHWRNKVVNHFDLISERPDEFDYDKISVWVSRKVLREATGEFMGTEKIWQAPAWEPAQPAYRQQYAPQASDFGQDVPFQPISNQEVDRLTEKYAKLRISNTSLASADWTTREKTLLRDLKVATYIKNKAEPLIRRQIEQQSDDFLQHFADERPSPRSYRLEQTQQANQYLNNQGY
jgi:hypothetical protein